MSGEDGGGVRDISNHQHVGARNTWAFAGSSDHDHLAISDLSWSKFSSLPLRSKTRIHKGISSSASASAAAADNTKHLDVKKWLKSMDLLQYEKTFEKFNGVEDLLEHSEADIKDLGVRISSHRATIISSITILRAKYHGNFRRQPSIRHSVADVEKTDNTDKSELSTIYEPVQSKSLNNLIMEPTADPTMNAHDLRKALEWELSLDSRDLRSHAWYHGAIPRARAEDIVREEGGFLVRDCTSQPGNYVLTCRTKTQPLHFVINKIVLQPDTVYEHVQYQFEEDAFDTVPDLITFYVGSGKAVTAASGARIQYPKNRMYPLSFYAAKYPAPLAGRLAPSPATTPIAPIRQGKASPTRNGGAQRLSAKKQRSQSLTPAEVNRISQEKCNSADGVIQSPLMTRSADSMTKFCSLPRTAPSSRLSLSSSSNTLGRNSRLTSDTPQLSPCAETKFLNEMDAAAVGESPPPKPSRVPSIIRLESKDGGGDVPDGGTFIQHGSLQRVTSYHASGSDSGNGSGDSALSSAAGDGGESNSQRNSGVIIKNPRYNLVTSDSSTTLKNFEMDYTEIEEKLMELEQPEINTRSRIDLENFQTVLLPVQENKPLDAQVLRSIKILLNEYGSRILANHLTRTDLDVIFYKPNKDSIEGKLGGECGGIELCALPHGHQFRLDLIERTECLKLVVAVTILTCVTDSERTELLNKWIEIAIDTKTALGNLFGFCGIMLGLCLPQVEKLDSTWHMLRQKYTDSAFNFEAKLRPTLKNMNSCSNPQAPNTTIPHLLPLVVLMERNLEDFTTPSNEQQQTQLNFWESNTQDFGLSTLLNHLETARKYMDQSATYQRNAEIVLGDARMEELLMDMFRSEFQMKFLWGSRGAFVPAKERHSKFEQILTALADKYCNIREEAEV